LLSSIDSSKNKFKGKRLIYLESWCQRRDSNPHGKMEENIEDQIMCKFSPLVPDCFVSIKFGA